MKGIAVHYVTAPDEHISIILPNGSALILRRGQGDYLFDRLAFALLTDDRAIWGKEDRPRLVPRKKKVTLEDLGLKAKPTLADLGLSKEKEDE
jgi:hypothetical protein